MVWHFGQLQTRDVRGPALFWACQDEGFVGWTSALAQIPQRDATSIQNNTQCDFKIRKFGRLSCCVLSSEALFYFRNCSPLSLARCPFSVFPVYLLQIRLVFLCGYCFCDVFHWEIEGVRFYINRSVFTFGQTNKSWRPMLQFLCLEFHKHCSDTIWGWCVWFCWRVM